MKNSPLFRRVVLVLDKQLHFLVALVLMACALVMLARAVPGIFRGGVPGLLEAVNNVLLALIFLEILWPVIRFLQQKPFRLHPFLYAGIISSTRRILLIEAEHSVINRAAAVETAGIDWQNSIALGANVGVILVLAVVLRIIPPHTDEDEL
jgi:uncharacterized membrane protein (DUF373 family)